MTANPTAFPTTPWRATPFRVLAVTRLPGFTHFTHALPRAARVTIHAGTLVAPAGCPPRLPTPFLLLDGPLARTDYLCCRTLTLFPPARDTAPFACLPALPLRLLTYRYHLPNTPATTCCLPSPPRMPHPGTCHCWPYIVTPHLRLHTTLFAAALAPPLALHPAFPWVPLPTPSQFPFCRWVPLHDIVLTHHHPQTSLPPLTHGLCIDATCRYRYPVPLRLVGRFSSVVLQPRRW